MDSTSAPVPAEKRQEVHQRFRWARRLIDDDVYRHRVFLIAALVAFPLIVSLTVLADAIPYTRVDLDTTVALQGVQLALFGQLMRFVSMFGYEPWAYIVIVAVLGLVALRVGRGEALYLGAITVAQGALNTLIKALIGRPRPVDTLVEVIVPSPGTSFPSGHVMFYTVFFGFLFLLLLLRAARSRLRSFLLSVTAGLVLLIGPSRIYLGAHWMSDVVAAYLIAMVILLLAVELYLKYVAPRRPGPEDLPGNVGPHP